MRILGTGLVYANPTPHLCTRHAFHPTLVDLGGGELLCGYDVGVAVEGLGYRTYLARSRDGGATWEQEGPLLADRYADGYTHSVRLSAAGGGLVGLGALHRRDDPGEGIVNHVTMGMVPMDLILVRSDDRGASWSEPQVIAAPLTGPAFEICHALVELPDGRWLAPTATWAGWDGARPSGAKTVVLASADGGRTWPEYAVMFDGTAEGVEHWEVSVVPLADGRLLAVSWVFHSESGTHRPNRYALSADGGRSFAPPAELGLLGQTCKALALQDGRVLFVYRRGDRPGLWAALSTLNGGAWQHNQHLPLWNGGLADSGMTGAGGASDELAALKFGFPQMLDRGGGEVLVAFWCFEDWSTRIRWIRLDVSG